MKKFKTYKTGFVDYRKVRFEYMYNLKSWKFGFGFRFGRYLLALVLFLGPLTLEVEHWRNVKYAVGALSAKS